MSPDKRDWLLVSETFLTLQGEGPSTGQLAYFIRLGACNLHCNWCDTPYTWAFDKRHAEMHESKKQFDPSKELKRIPISKMARTIIESNSRLCVITGGEPLLQLGPLAELISLVNESVYAPRFEFETAGTLWPGELTLFENVAFNVSLKLASSGNTKAERYIAPVVEAFARLEKPEVRFKFVVDTRYDDHRNIREDLQEIGKIVRDHDIDNRKVWLMPCGTTSAEIDQGLRLLAPLVIKQRWNLTGRQHVMIWGNARGR